MVLTESQMLHQPLQVPSRRLARRLRKQNYRIQIDADFAAVVALPIIRPSPVKNRTDAVEGIRGSDTWITDDMASAYQTPSGRIRPLSRMLS